ncbi:MAG TPA: hypothetical protein ENJ82_00125 [Bacteroidetes bacterium]|nr:hypothetical protein [Bacteroidota bacterium]
MRQFTFSQKGLFFLLLVTVVTGTFGCKNDNPDFLDYDRALLLENVGKNYILPAYANAMNKGAALLAAGDSFAQSGTLADLSAAHTALREARLAWLACSPFEFGPAAATHLRGVLNTFPADPQQIEANIMAGFWNLEQASNVDARGFPAIDYLLHHADDASIRTEFTTANHASSRQQLLQALLADVKSALENTFQGWNATGDNYLAEFIGKLGTDAGSSSALLVNQLNLDLEQLKTARIGIPLGKRSLGVTLPEKVESRYGSYSSALAMAHLQAIRAIYEGQHFSTTTTIVDGYGIFEALEALDAKYNGKSLAIALRDQFSRATTAINDLPDPLADAVVNNPAPLEVAYSEIQKLVILLKTDMPSAMSILITYTDTDGD